MNNFLQLIRSKTQQRLAREKPTLPIIDRKPNNFLPMLAKQQPAFIAEIKFATPLIPQLARTSPNATAIAGNYLNNQASALSIITEPDYFKGSLADLYAIRCLYSQAFLLMKDFIISDQQLYQARNFGADAILLIAKLLSFNELEFLYNKSLELHLTPLVEVNNEVELRQAERLDAKLIGVNNRDLSSLTVNLNTAKYLISRSHKQASFVALSGIHEPAYIRELKNLGYQALVIGSHLMNSNDPGATLNQLINEVNRAD